MPSLSIIIPVYNVEAYLSRCLDSILVDDLFTGQVICVNDGSTDNSLLILEQYARKYSNVEIISQENSGLSVARNVGFNSATGDYVFFVDSDDWIEKGAIEKVLKYIDDEDVLYFNAKIFEDTKQCFKEPVDISACSKISGSAYYTLIYRQPQNMPRECVWGGIYRREFLIKNNIYHEPGILHEDAYFTPQVLLAANKVSRVNDVVYVYRVRQGSIMSTMGEKNIKDLLFITRNLYTLYEKTVNVAEVFYQELFDKYVNIINIGYDIAVPVHCLWHCIDSKIMLRGAHNEYHRKIAKLTFFSPRIAYKFMQNSCTPIIRKAINRFL